MNINDLNLAANLGLLTAGAGLLEGQSFNQALRGGLGAYSLLDDISVQEEERRRQEQLSQTAVGLLGLPSMGPYRQENQALANLASAAPEAVIQQSLGKMFAPPSERKAVNVLLPDGKTTLGSSTQTGEIYIRNPDGSTTLAPFGSQIFGSNVQASSKVDLGTGLAPNAQAQFDSLRQKYTSTVNLVNTGNEVIDLIDQDKLAGTFTGQLSSVAARAQEQASEIFERAKSDPNKLTTDGFGVTIDAFSGTFEELGIADVKLRTKILDLAYQAAAARGQAGRGASDKDIRIFAEIVGGKGTAEARKQALQGFLNASVRELNTELDSVKRFYPTLSNRLEGIDFAVPTINAGRQNPVAPSISGQQNPGVPEMPVNAGADFSPLFENPDTALEKLDNFFKTDQFDKLSPEDQKRLIDLIEAL